MKRILILFVLCGAPWAGRAWGHGLAASVVEGGVGVAAVYDDGTPVAFSEVKVYAPGPRPERPVLTAVTDRNGVFLFRPDTNGEWTVSVDDGMGHAVTTAIPWSGAAADTASRAAPRLPKTYGAIVGVSLIFGIFGWCAYGRAVLGRRAGT